jgi:hypothetical protein
MIRLPFGLLQDASVTRRMLFVFTLLSAGLNGLVTASVGAWLAQKYASTQQRREAVNGLSSLLYERRIKAGMVVSSMRRNAELDEIKDRKRSYDATYVDWNKNIRQNLFMIREVMGETQFSDLEQDFENLLIAPLSQMDACLTRAYDQRIALQDPKPQLETCKMADLYQLTLDCGAAFTNELYKLTRIKLLPFQGASGTDRNLARARINKACARAPAP